MRLIALILKLMVAQDSRTSEEACDEWWAPDGDAQLECYCALETYRCEVQGWCDPPVGGVRPVTDPARPSTWPEGCD